MRFLSRAPVVPGVGIMVTAPCIACRAPAPDGMCADFRACCDRYRGGASPESYAAGLRGELLAVTP